MAVVIAICGPTASGKTGLGVALARQFGGEIVSADSMQIYKRMDIGTAKPTPEEMGGIPHHMIDVADPRETYSAGRYVSDATRCVDDILQRGKLPILVGGTGLYMDSLIAGRAFAPFTGGYREKLQARAKNEGIEPLFGELQAIDPQRHALLHPADEKRILRALEVFYETGETITEHDEKTRRLPPKYDALRFGLQFESRALLNARIDGRVDEMFARGLFREVEELLAEGLPPNATAMQAIGYKEVVAAVRGEESVEAAREQVKLRSRQYAKRQETWLARTENLHRYVWGNPPNLQDALHNATSFLAENGIS
ncbi:MAG: tRNA (adenosine(37)-N6)-dimethylallyltransferase MiaA [Oscillospiraceae bacterium]